MPFLAELRRRNVVRVAIAYLVFSWLVLQVGDVLFPALNLPHWSITLVAVLLAIGFVAVLVFSWVYELTPEGIKRERDIEPGASVKEQTGQKLNFVIAGMLVLAIVILAGDRFGGREESMRPADPATVPEDSRSVVAVLPFKATGSDDGGFLAAGLHDDLLTRLAKMNAFRVISRTSMMEYADTARNMREIGEELGAGFILEGSVLSKGDRVRVNAQLIDTRVDGHVWADSYDRDLTATDLFDLQSELARAIAAQLQSSLDPESAALVEAAPPANMAAYNAYLRAGQHQEKQGFSLPVVDAVIRDAEEAVRLDPNFALAWARLSDAYSRHVRLHGDTESRRKALEAFAKARALQPDLLEVELAWVVYLYHGLDEFEQALTALENLQGRADGNADFLALKSYVYRRLGKFDVSYRTMLEALKLDPKDRWLRTEIVQMAIWAGDCEAARRHAEEALRVLEGDDLARVRVATYETHCGGNYERVKRLLQDREFDTDWHLWAARVASLHARDTEWMLELAMRDLPEPYSMSEPQNQLYRAWILRLVGRDDEAQSIVNDVGTMLRNWDEGDVAANRAMYAWLMAQYYSLRKDKEQTLRWHREYWNQSFPEGKLDLYLLTDNLPFMAANLADAGLHDEAVELLRRLFDNPGGATWRYIDADPTLDVLDGHPGFEALRDEYGS